MSGPPTYPITVQSPVDDEQSNRWLAVSGIILVKPILLLPHIVLLFLFGLMIQILAWIGYWGIAFTDRMPDLIRRLELIFLRLDHPDRCLVRRHHRRLPHVRR